MANIKWNHKPFFDKVVSNALSGIEEWARTEWQPQAKQDCPVKEGTMRDSLGVERSDSEKAVYVGGGGPAKKYIFRQEMDRSLNHTVGKAGFIRDSVSMKSSKIVKYVEKHIK